MESLVFTAIDTISCTLGTDKSSYGRLEMSWIPRLRETLDHLAYLSVIGHRISPLTI